MSTHNDMLTFRSNEGAQAGGYSKDKQLANFDTEGTCHSLTVSNSDASSKEVAHDKKKVCKVPVAMYCI